MRRNFLRKKILRSAQNDRLGRDSARLSLTRELSSVSETEGEKEFLRHLKRTIFFLSLRLFAAQKSTSLVRGRLAPTTSLFVVHGTMWASSPTQREGKWWRRFFALLRMTGRIRNSASLPLAAADVHPPQAFPSRGRLALDITQSIITHKHTTPPRGQMTRGRGCTTY